MEIQEDVSIADATTFKIGGVIKYILKPRNREEFVKSFSYIKGKHLPHFVIGAGSNVLIGDKYYEGGAIITIEMSKIERRGDILAVESGCSNTDVSLYCLKHGISGFEFLYGMPGTVGGSTYMNARAFGGSMEEVVKEVEVLDYESLSWRVYEGEELKYSYKDSVFQRGVQDKIYATYFTIDGVKKGYGKEEIRAKMLENKKHRVKSKQYSYRSAGCVFKNDYELGVPAGKLIDEAGLKGKDFGGVKISEEHANFIINRGIGSSEDVLKLINYVKRKVKQERKIDMECEIQFLGSF